MITVRLYGHLKDFGREFILDVKTPAAAVGALCKMIPGFRSRLQGRSEPGYHIRVGQEFRDKDGIRMPCGQREIVKIIPATAGSGATARVVVGVVLLVIAYVFPVTAPYLAPMGVALIAGGVAELLAPKPKKQDANSDSTVAQSYSFSGPMNTSGQGVPVFVGFGRLLVGSHLASGQIYTEEMPLTGIGDVAPGDLANQDDGVSHVIGTAPGNWSE